MNRKTSLIHSERGSLELTQQAMIAFFIVVMLVIGAQGLLSGVDTQAQTTSSWLVNENPACAGETCVDFTIGNSSNKYNPYKSPD